jgi:DNA primase
VDRVYEDEQINTILRESGICIEGEVSGDYLIFCPYHNNYRTPAGEVSKEKGTFFCFSCHESRSLIELVMHTTKKSYFESSRFIDSAKGEIDILGSLDKILVEKVDYVSYDEIQIKRLGSQGRKSPRAVWYFESRRISTDSMAKFSLGYSEKQDMITVPINDPSGSMFVGFVGRSVEGKRFKNTPNLPKSKVLFNLHRAKRYDTVYVVESSFDAIRLDQCGLASVASLGSNISKFQIELLTKSFNSVIVIPDNDDAGKNMADKIIDKVGTRAVAFSLPNRFKDIGDMSDADIKQLDIKTSDPLLAMYK